MLLVDVFTKSLSLFKPVTASTISVEVSVWYGTFANIAYDCYSPMLTQTC